MLRAPNPNPPRACLTRSLFTARLTAIAFQPLAVARSGWSSADAPIRVTGPVPGGAPTSSLFDVSAPCENATVRSLSREFERRRKTAYGLTREWWGWDTWGNGTTQDRPAGMSGNWYGSDAGPSPWVRALGCVSAGGCAGAIASSGLPPNGTDVIGDGQGIAFPPVWRGLRSYAARLSGWFVPPFTADYRFVVHTLASIPQPLGSCPRLALYPSAHALLPMPVAHPEANGLPPPLCSHGVTGRSTCASTFRVTSRRST